MSGSCCNRSLSRIISVGNAQVGIVGFREIMEAATTASPANDSDLAEKLLSSAKERGNYVTPGTEEIYKVALLREYHRFVAGKLP